MESQQKQQTTAGVMADLDVRTLPPRQRHELIFARFLALAPGEALQLINDHDPKPLHYQFQAEHPGEVDWQYLEQGPEVWRVRIGRVTPGTPVTPDLPYANKPALPIAPMPEAQAVPTFSLPNLFAEQHASGAKKPTPRLLFDGPELKVILFYMPANAQLAEHLAPGQITIHALFGRLRVGAAGTATELPAGTMLTLERRAPHDVMALEESSFLLTIALGQS